MKRLATYSLFLFIILVYSCSEPLEQKAIKEHKTEYSDFTCDDSNKLNWNKRNQLTWLDFLGIADSTSIFDAYTSTQICYSYKWKETNRNISVDTEVKTYFLLEQSWKIEDKITSSLLEHEQGHFDIAELHGRLLRKAFIEFTFTNKIEIEIDSIYNSIIDEGVLMEENYDLETEHSLNKDKQVEWNEYLISRLQQLDVYK